VLVLAVIVCSIISNQPSECTVFYKRLVGNTISRMNYNVSSEVLDHSQLSATIHFIEYNTLD